LSRVSLPSTRKEIARRPKIFYSLVKRTNKAKKIRGTQNAFVRTEGPSQAWIRVGECKKREVGKG